jgi:hypothetical protein
LITGRTENCGRERKLIKRHTVRGI